MSEGIGRLELARLALQAQLDAGRSRIERNRLGQFATPPALARDMLAYGVRLHTGGGAIRFLDPASGTGAFYSALRKVVPRSRIAEALAFEADPHYGASIRLWQAEGLRLRREDFTRAGPEARFNLLVCNPPYVRHHHLSGVDKHRLRRRSLLASGMSLSGLAGLYCHFLGIAHPWLAREGIAGWLIPSEFMDVNYGHAVKRYLLERVTLLHVHRFDPRDLQFADALVSSAAVWYRNAPPLGKRNVRFTFGGSLLAPQITNDVAPGALRAEEKWTRLAQPRGGRRREAQAPPLRVRRTAPTLAHYFDIRRGIATGDNSYFILPEGRVAELGLPAQALTPILPSPRYLPHDEVRSQDDGTPRIARRLFLIDTALEEQEIEARYPQLAAYLAHGKQRGVAERYLCAHRSPWYRQEHRPAAPIVCTYMARIGGARGGAFRFILNGSRATVANVYLALYPTQLLQGALARNPSLLRRIWRALQRVAPERLVEQGRVYGGGLHKLEPRELGNVRVHQIAALVSIGRHSSGRHQV